MRAAVTALICLAALPPIARGQASLAVTQARALSDAQQNAPQVLVSLARADVAQADVDVAGALPNPQIGGGVSPAYLFIATFYVRIPAFGQRSMAQRAALAQSRVASASVDLLRLDARLAASLAWIDLWATLRETDLAERDVARYDRLSSAADARVADGSSPRLDGLRAHADARRAHARSAALAAARAAASARLALLLGQPPDATLLPSGEPSTGAPPAAADLDALLDAHPLLRHARATRISAQAAQDREQRARWPELGISVQDWAARATRVHDLRVLATINVPLFDAPRVARAQAEVSASQASASAATAQLRAGAFAARADYQAAWRRCEVLTDSVVPATREVAEQSEKAYVEGALDLSTTQIAVQAQSASEWELQSCTADRARAWARLEHALGGPGVE